MIICMDKGTENGLIGAVQYALRENSRDSFAGAKSAMYGTSPANSSMYLYYVPEYISEN